MSGFTRCVGLFVLAIGCFWVWMLKRDEIKLFGGFGRCFRFVFCMDYFLYGLFRNRF